MVHVNHHPAHNILFIGYCLIVQVNHTRAYKHIHTNTFMYVFMHAYVHTHQIHMPTSVLMHAHYSHMHTTHSPALELISAN